MSRASTTTGLLLAALCGTGCVAHYHLPMTAAELSQDGSAGALVAYLGQKDASVSVCDPSSTGPHFSRFDGPLRDALRDALVDGRIEPDLWQQCVWRVLKRLEPASSERLAGELAPLYQRLIDDGRIETDAEWTDRMAAVQRLVTERRPETADPKNPSPLAGLIATLRSRLASGKLGPIASRFAQELVHDADVSQGQWDGKPIDVAMMDALAAAGNEMTLSRFARAAPAPDLREEARRRIVRVHIVVSPFPEVRSKPQAVEETVMREGRNPVALAQHPVVRTHLGPAAPARQLLVEQHVWTQTARLLGATPGQNGVSVVPDLLLRGLLTAELAGFSRPVEVCRGTHALDVNPCLATSDFSIDSPYVYLDKGARFHFRDNLRTEDILPLAQQAAFPFPLRIGGRDAAVLRWSLTFLPPEPMVFIGPAPAARGPDVKVLVEPAARGRYVFHAGVPEGTFSAMVEGPDLGGFRVGSRGAQGFAGAPGADGADGSDGGECENGGNGGNGEDGEDGGPGGDGGNVFVRFQCQGATCSALGAPLTTVVISQGGFGGRGGAGGAGGRGGSGGSGRASDDQSAGCPGGSSGASGASGADGRDGPPGRPGRAFFE